MNESHFSDMTSVACKGSRPSRLPQSAYCEWTPRCEDRGKHCEGNSRRWGLGLHNGKINTKSSHLLSERRMTAKKRRRWQVSEKGSMQEMRGRMERRQRCMCEWRRGVVRYRRRPRDGGWRSATNEEWARTLDPNLVLNAGTVHRVLFTREPHSLIFLF